MARLRFSIARLMGFVVLAAFCLAAIKQSTAIWASLTFTLALITFPVCVLIAIYRTGKTRAFCLGMSIVGAPLLISLYIEGIFNDDDPVPTLTTIISMLSPDLSNPPIQVSPLLAPAPAAPTGPVNAPSIESDPNVSVTFTPVPPNADGPNPPPSTTNATLNAENIPVTATTFDFKIQSRPVAPGTTFVPLNTNTNAFPAMVVTPPLPDTSIFWNVVPLRTTLVGLVPLLCGYLGGLFATALAGTASRQTATEPTPTPSTA